MLLKFNVSTRVAGLLLPVIILTPINTCAGLLSGIGKILKGASEVAEESPKIIRTPNIHPNSFNYGMPSDQLHDIKTAARSFTNNPKDVELWFPEGAVDYINKRQHEIILARRVDPTDGTSSVSPRYNLVADDLDNASTDTLALLFEKYPEDYVKFYRTITHSDMDSFRQHILGLITHQLQRNAHTIALAIRAQKGNSKEVNLINLQEIISPELASSSERFSAALPLIHRWTIEGSYLHASGHLGSVAITRKYPLSKLHLAISSFSASAGTLGAYESAEHFDEQEFIRLFENPKLERRSIRIIDSPTIKIDQ